MSSPDVHRSPRLPMGACTPTCQHGVGYSRWSPRACEGHRSVGLMGSPGVLPTALQLETKNMVYVIRVTCSQVLKKGRCGGGGSWKEVGGKDLSPYEAAQVGSCE